MSVSASSVPSRRPCPSRLTSRAILRFQRTKAAAQPSMCDMTYTHVTGPAGHAAESQRTASSERAGFMDQTDISEGSTWEQRTSAAIRRGERDLGICSELLVLQKHPDPMMPLSLL